MCSAHHCKSLRFPDFCLHLCLLLQQIQTPTLDWPLSSWVAGSELQQVQILRSCPWWPLCHSVNLLWLDKKRPDQWPLLIQYQSRVCVILTHNKVHAVQGDTINGYDMASIKWSDLWRLTVSIINIQTGGYHKVVNRIAYFTSQQKSQYWSKNAWNVCTER